MKTVMGETYTVRLPAGSWSGVSGRLTVSCLDLIVSSCDIGQSDESDGLSLSDGRVSVRLDVTVVVGWASTTAS